jgi:mono/diheme cytochrome c family protein
VTSQGPPPIETGHEPIPRWLAFLGAAIALVGVVSLSGNLEGENPDLVGPLPSEAVPSPPASGEPPPSGAPPSGEPQDAVALIEEAGCQACHGEDLGGQGTFPSLRGLAEGPVSENLQQLGEDYPDTWAHLWIDGTVPEVEGLDRGGMPAFGGPGGQLTTEEIATIVEFLLTLE